MRILPDQAGHNILKLIFGGKPYEQFMNKGKLHAHRVATCRNHLVLFFNQWQRSTVDRDLAASCIVRRVVRVLTSPRMNVPHFAMHRTLWFVPFDMTCNINQYRMYIISSKSKSSITTDSRILEPNP